MKVAASTRVLRGTAVLAAFATLACGAPGDRPEPAPPPALDAVSAPAKAPNVVIVTVDTLRADHCSSYGYGRPTTPTLDALARAGALFERAYSVTATTLPSHVSLFTGLHPDEHGIANNGHTLSADVTPVAESFARAGYETAAFVSSFVLERRFGLRRGFAVYDDDFEGADSSLGRSRTSFQGHEVPGAFDRRANATTDRAIEWLEARDGTRPFLLWVHYFDPHDPYDPPEPHRGRFARDGQTGERERVTDLYDAEIGFTDAQLGRLLAAVRSTAPPDQTLTVVTSDHGEGLGDHGWLRHGVNVYEEAVRVPLVVHWPGRIPPGLRITGPVTSADLVPTLAGLTGMALGAAGSRSADQSAILLGGAAPDIDRPVFFQRRVYASRTVEHLRVAGPKRAVRWRDWKLIDSPEEIGFELYDLARDPGEHDNLAGRAPERLRELRAHLDDWSRDSGPRGLDPQAAMSDEVRERLAALGYVE